MAGQDVIGNHKIDRQLDAIEQQEAEHGNINLCGCVGNQRVKIDAEGWEQGCDALTNQHQDFRQDTEAEIREESEAQTVLVGERAHRQARIDMHAEVCGINDAEHNCQQWDKEQMNAVFLPQSMHPGSQQQPEHGQIRRGGFGKHNRNH